MANTILFYADYTKSGVAQAPTAAPTITVYSVNRATLAEALVGSAGSAMTASALTGRYFYKITSADLSTYDYHARVSTTDAATGLDARDLPCLWVRWSEAVATDSSGNLTDARLANLDAAVSTRSVYAGGAVASVTGAVGSVAAAVTVGTNNDKSGYSLAVAPPTSAVVAAAVWDLATSGHTTSGTFGAAVVAAASAGDPWSTALPGAYGSGTAGAILGNRAGFKLAGDGLDAVAVESGLNARQSLSVIAAAAGGALAGADTGNVVIKGAGVLTTRIIATTDSTGRTAVLLSPPA